jgi:hypothetical protein
MLAHLSSQCLIMLANNRHYDSIQSHYYSDYYDYYDYYNSYCSIVTLLCVSLLTTNDYSLITALGTV